MIRITDTHQHRRERDRGKLRPRLRARRAERQQALDRGAAALRRAPLAVAAERRGDPADAARRQAADQGRRAGDHAQRHRTQERNRADALDRLVELIREAAVRPVPRRATRPTKASKQRRLEGKKRRSGIKGMRQGRPARD